MEAGYGWWQFDRQRAALMNTNTGQTVSFTKTISTLPASHEAFEDNGAEGGEPRTTSALTSAQWYQFKYEDAEIKALLQVFARVHSGPRQNTTCYWFVQHSETVVLHPDEVPIAALPYGYWRRIEDCVIDAFMCWPEIDATGKKAQFVVSNGGWFNGVWTDDVRRKYTNWFRLLSRPLTPFPASIQSLDAKPQRWQFEDADSIDLKALWAGFQEHVPGIFSMKKGYDFEGLSGRMPLLREIDGPGFMGLAGIDSRVVRETYRAGGYAFYRDADIFFCLNMEAFPGWQWILSNWKFSLKPFRITAGTGSVAGRAPKLPSEHAFAQALAHPCRPENPLGSPTPSARLEAFYLATYDYPSPDLARRVEIALTEGWMHWRSKVPRLLDNPDKLEKMRRVRPKDVPAYEKSGLDLGAKWEVFVEGRYVGGDFHPKARVWLGFIPKSKKPLN